MRRRKMAGAQGCRGNNVVQTPGALWALSCLMRRKLCGSVPWSDQGIQGVRWVSGHHMLQRKELCPWRKSQEVQQSEGLKHQRRRPEEKMAPAGSPTQQSSSSQSAFSLITNIGLPEEPSEARRNEQERRKEDADGPKMKVPQKKNQEPQRRTTRPSENNEEKENNIKSNSPGAIPTCCKPVRIPRWLPNVLTRRCVATFQDGGALGTTEKRTTGADKTRLSRKISKGDTGSEDRIRYSSTQPEPKTALSSWDPSHSCIDTLVQGISFSQPVCPDHMLLNSQLLGTPGASQNPWHRLVKRLTRFFTKLDADQSYSTLKDVCENMGYTWKRSCANQVTISTKDRRNNKLIFKVNLVEMDQKILVDFRLSKGDGLEFKRHFLKIKGKLKDVVSSEKNALPVT